MRRYILTGHGRISEGIASAAELIIGQKVQFFNAYLPGEEFFAGEIAKQIESFSPEDEVIIMTDLLGGSVNNEMTGFLEYDNVHLICGVNLALVIGLLLSDETKSIEQVIEKTIEESKQGIVYCNEWKKKQAETLDDF
ncbi:MAG: PTS fructose transporter subunit IIA [Clostridiales bacterium]|nr:PTS fructose transporter subunit IIA [Clostridiales bacterium]